MEGSKSSLQKNTICTREILPDPEELDPPKIYIYPFTDAIPSDVLAGGAVPCTNPARLFHVDVIVLKVKIVGLAEAAKNICISNFFSTRFAREKTNETCRECLSNLKVQYYCLLNTSTVAAIKKQNIVDRSHPIFIRCRWRCSRGAEFCPE